MAVDRPVEEAKGEIGPDAGGSSWPLPALAAAVSVLALALTLRLGGALHPAVPTLRQAGFLTTSGLPIAELAANATGALTVGWLLAALLLPPREGRELSGAGRRCVRAASMTALAWALCTLAVAAFSASDLVGVPITTVLTDGELLGYLTDLSSGRAVLAVTVIATVVSVMAGLPRTTGGTGYVLGLAMLGLLPPVFTGHATTHAGDHALAVFSLIVHVVAAAGWVGGLAVLLVIGTWRYDRLPEVVPRYSRLALACFVAVGASGVVNAWIRLGGLHLGSPYGVLVLVKTAALTALAALGWWHRRSAVPTLRDRRDARLFLRVAAVEIIVMAVAFALATGLSRTPPPPADLPWATGGDVLLGFRFPGPAGPRAYALGWWADPLFLALVLAGAASYAAALVVLRRRGVSWPVPRTVSWFAGLAIAFAATSSGLGRYSMVLFSAHLVQHLLLGVFAPVLLLLGAPLTLAGRAVAADPAAAGTGHRRLAVAAAHGRMAWLLTHPLVAPVLFVCGLYGFYSTGLFEASLRAHAVHSLTMAGFVGTGLLYLWPIIGIDPAPHRMRPATRLSLVLVVAPYHAFFGISLMRSTGVLAPDWYSALGRGWGTSDLHDQHTAGLLALALGGTATALIVLIVAVQRSRERARGTLRPAHAAPPPPPHRESGTLIGGT